MHHHQSEYNDRLRDQAYKTLRQRFPTWEQVRDAPEDQVVGAIQVAGLGQTKGPHIQSALRRITTERGRLELEFLRGMPVEEAKGWLTAMKGVGPKTAAIVLLFSLDRPAFPVDTHIHRLACRWGLSSGKSVAQTEKDLKTFFPKKNWNRLHLQMIYFGREYCQARSHQKSLCPICSWII